jgi:hypothetical protein
MLSTAEGLVDLCRREGRTMELRTFSGLSARLAPAPLAREEAHVLLAGLLPRAALPRADLPRADLPRADLLRAALPRATATGLGSGGTVLTTATGARSLPDGVERIVVGR